MTKFNIQSQLKKFLVKKYPNYKDEVILEYPPDSKMGDLGFPCFGLAKIAKKSPNEIAKELAQEFPSNSAVNNVQAVGPYLNFFLNKEMLWKEIFVPRDSSLMAHDSRIMVEFSSPNTNKPLHLGHIRNNVIGDSVSRLLKLQNRKVIKASLVNDRGIHICKSMLAYQKVQSGEWSAFTKVSADKKGDHVVGDYYVLYSQKEKNNPNLIKEVQDLLKKWEAGDKETIKLWKKMNKMVLAGFAETYKRMGVKFDKTYFESKEYKNGKKIILKQLKAGLPRLGVKAGKCYKRADGAIEIDLTKYGLDKKVLVRADGTSVYITQDIGLAVSRQKNLKLNKIIYVVANEQDYHFKVLFKILDIFGYKWAKNLYHLNYAMVNLPSGKMKSREGAVVDADDLMDQTVKLACQEIKKRLPRHQAGEPKISQTELNKRAEKIGLGAMKFYLLKHSPDQTILYNPLESISFEGATGPYIQYTYARIQSILRKSTSKKQKNKKTKKQLSTINYQQLSTDEEWNIAKLLARFNEVVTESADELNPAKLATYLLDLTSAFNTFYHKHKVLKAANKDLVNARLVLTNAVAEKIKTGLELLGIEVVEKM